MTDAIDQNADSVRRGRVSTGHITLLPGDCATLDHVEFVSVYKDLDLIV